MQLKRVMSSPELPEEEVLGNTRLKIFLWIISTKMRMWQWSTSLKAWLSSSAGHTSGTLVNALMYHVKDLSSINGVVRPVVHRIDKDTSDPYDC